MEGNDERESETHLLTDLIIKHVQQVDKSEFIHDMYIHATVFHHDTVFQKHRHIQLVDQKKKMQVKYIGTKSKERTPILSDKYSIHNGNCCVLTLNQSVRVLDKSTGAKQQQGRDEERHRHQ